MHLLTKTFRIAPGRAGAALAWAGVMALDASGVSGSAVTRWINVYGAPPDTLVLSARADSPAAVEHLIAALPGDPCRAESLFIGSPVEEVGEVIAHFGGCGPPPLFASVVTVWCQPEGLVDAIAAAVEEARIDARLTGLRSAVVRGREGSGSTMLRRITVAESLAALDCIEAKVSETDAGAQRLLLRRFR